MDSEVTAVLARYDQRAEKELALMQAMAPDEMMQHVDEFLISIIDGVLLPAVGLPRPPGRVRPGR